MPFSCTVQRKCVLQVSHQSKSQSLPVSKMSHLADITILNSLYGRCLFVFQNYLIRIYGKAESIPRKSFNQSNVTNLLSTFKDEKLARLCSNILWLWSPICQTLVQAVLNWIQEVLLQTVWQGFSLKDFLTQKYVLSHESKWKWKSNKKLYNLMW